MDCDKELFLDYCKWCIGDIVLVKEDRFRIIDKGKDFLGRLIILSDGERVMNLRSDKNMELIRSMRYGNRSLSETY